ncbi:MAG: hypothetical protein H8E28_14380 [Anaerolineae bacterium]|nr:hypothetical protein [Anaerolineae bacterium]
MTTILFATQNQWKNQLFRPIFQNYGFELIGLRDAGIERERPIENGTTVAENALIKARHYCSDSFPWVFADDMGVAVDALDGEPGVQARRWGGLFPDDVENQIWLDYLLARLEGIPPKRRAATFLDGWALVSLGGGAFTREISSPFEIAEQPIRPAPPGSPIVAVAIGFPDTPQEIFSQAKAHFDDWGIFDQLARTGELQP